MSGLGSVVIEPDGSGWRVICTRPGRASQCQPFQDRANAITFAANVAALQGLAFLDMAGEATDG